MDKISSPWLINILSVTLLAVLGWSGNNALNNLSAQIKDIDSKLSAQIKDGRSALDIELRAINSTLKEHGDSLSRIHNYLLYKDSDFIHFVNSINKLKQLNDKEFDVLKGVAHNNAAPFEILSMETEEILDKYNIEKKDLDIYKAIGPSALTELWAAQ